MLAVALAKTWPERRLVQARVMDPRGRAVWRTGAEAATRRSWCARLCLTSRSADSNFYFLRRGRRCSQAMSMPAVTPETLALREMINERRVEFLALLAKYRATNPTLFGSVARGTARDDSDVDLLAEMDPVDGNLLMRASGLMEETRLLFGAMTSTSSRANFSSVLSRKQHWLTRSLCELKPTRASRRHPPVHRSVHEVHRCARESRQPTGRSRHGDRSLRAESADPR
ncbi:nucleotidyltransferase family protein [Pseudoclavibacter sp. AY1F1]|uniref:nucleotidyltransferase family protein n=1 Tax=Pseudoclavibacter sp. AY1F1 TaxID=2080583 RepID=UPI0026D96FEA